MPSDTYVLYTDDSGDGAGDVFFSGLLIPIDQWTESLRRWLKFRRWMHKQHQVSARYELHAYQWIPAKDVPVPGDPTAPVNTTKGIRQQVAENGLKTISKLPGLGVITVRHPSPVKADAYETLLNAVDDALRKQDAWALLVVDGDPKNPDPHVRDAHRKLDIERRRIIEDGWHQDASMSQFIQMADLVAHSAFQAHDRAPGRQFMWDWYKKHIHAVEWHCGCP